MWNKKALSPLRADEIGIIKWYVETSYATHNDCRDHIRAMMTLGGSTITSFSRKQRINTKSSTEAELVGVDEALPQIYQNILYQDNQSAMILETNGKTVHSKWTKHIKVQYFFIKD